MWRPRERGPQSCKNLSNFFLGELEDYIKIKKSKKEQGNSPYKAPETPKEATKDRAKAKQKITTIGHSKWAKQII